MLIGLKQTTKVGDQIPATLTFASGAKLAVSFKVGMAAPAAAIGGMRH
jgi:copper(I)-binding protein